ncbi:hypothetical protein ERE_31400 [Agathobacter rectalis M104/1]|uniref:DUF5057 domain-containing protein n=2 Tax=Agathobacter TaxID=1766253 RepID=UPI0001CD2434|nr:DUF5057 domain-containing protein [Agathobacter rectalis]CBK94911.1 hypothetical protein ERE_31400 [Agathobacter rectalis M104/1]
MSKLRKKIVVPISLTLTGCLVVAAFVLNDSLTKVDANVAFNGISDIVSSHGKDKPFNIVEVVPDKKMASIGYLIDGQEPDDWFGTLKKMSDEDGAGVQKRADYMSGLKTKLEPITTENKDNTKPLYYEPYEESYVNQGDGWSELKLVNMDRINQGTSGYKMTKQENGDYKFNTDYKLSVDKDGLPTGQYRQNVDYYVFMQGDDETEDGSESVDTGSTGNTENENGNQIKAPGKRGYYSVAFTAVELPNGMTNTQYLVSDDNTQKADGNTDSSTDNTKEAGTGDDTVEKHVVYAIKSSYAIVSDKGMQNVAKYDPKAYIYRADNSDTTSPYKFVARADQMAALAGANKPDYDKYTYYTVEMEYVPADKITDDETYYEVDSNVPIEFNYDETGEYGAVLDTQNPYEKINTGDTSTTDSNEANEKIILHDTDGYFDIVKDSQTYTYVGEGNGDYIMVADKNGSLDYPVNTTHIYYKGGFKNNNWFRTGVFNQEGKTGDDDKTANMTFKVKTVTPKELEQIDVSTIDLLYLSGSKSVLSNDLVNDAATYKPDNDISWDKVKQIVQRVHQSGIMMPVIVDNGIVWASSSADYSSNIKKLAGLLSCNNFSSLNFTKDSAGNFINWNNDIKYYKVDSKTHTKGFVIGNEYVIPRNYNPSTDVPFVLRDDFASAFIANEDETQFVEAAKNENFDEIAEYINSENTSRKKENDTLGKDEYAYYDKEISKAIVLSYIISYADKRDIINPTDSLNILDIEPGTVKNESDALNYDKLKKWLGTRCPEQKKVTITRVTSAEFIGRIEDLNNYDMIYMGLVADNLNYRDGHTVYNDWKMDGLKYSNVGDIVVINPNDYVNYWGYNMLKNGHAGLLDTDYINDGTKLNTNLTLRNNGNNADYLTAPNTYRGSGNDITKQKVSELEDYIKAGFPVVFSDGFFSTVYGRGINEEYIDNCSNVFTLLCYAKDKDNVLKVDSKGNLKKQSNETADLVTYLTTEKPEILLKEQEKVKDTDYVEISNNQITLEFSINNAGGADSKASFNAQLFLDSNSDGKFSTTNEGIAANKIKLYCDGTIVNPVMGDDGKYMYSLNAGNYNYKLVYDLPNGFVGVMPWQLRVSQATNSYRYDQKSGYVYVKNSKGSPTKVKILQINSKLEHNEDFRGNFDMQTQKNDSNTKFHKLLSQVKDFDLDIETVRYDNVPKMDEVCDKLQTYDMLVIGFGDCYDIDNTNNHLDKIKAYIQSGKPVLFAHDTTSFCNNKNDTRENNVWGYKFNSIIRDTVGLDRYGILSNEYLKKGNTLKSTDEDFDKAVQTAEKNNTDIAYEPKSDNSVIVRQNQGFTYADLNQYQWKDNGNDHGEYRLYSGLDGNDVEAKTNKAVKVNSGQITTYPFKIADEINIATTHKQYYQLDMNQDADGDGESDIVVWYTLSNHGIYEQSPKDVRNNYYIYTMGNVTYSGVGHSDFSNNEDELKLYINTMIAAYSASVHEPSIYLKENADTDSNDITTLYATIDDAIEEEAANKADARLDGADSTQDVYFTVKDSNLVRNQIDEKTVVYLDFYIEDPQKNPKDETIGTGNDKIYLKKVDWDIYTLNNDGTENEQINNSKENSQLNKDPRDFFENNKTYKVKVPLSALPEGANSIKIYAVGYSKIYQSQVSGGDKETTTAKAYKTFQIQRVGLADLD